MIRPAEHAPSRGRRAASAVAAVSLVSTLALATVGAVVGRPGPGLPADGTDERVAAFSVKWPGAVPRR